MKRVLFILLIILTAATGIFADGVMETRQDFDAFIQAYYQKPEPGRISDAIAYLARNPDIELNDIPMVAGFFSCIFSDNREQRDKWKAEIDALQGNAKDTLAAAFNTIPELLMAKVGPSAYQNDMCWGAFFASGDTRFLEKITDQTIYHVERDDLNLFFAGTSARVSLADRARTHQAVREYLEDRIRTGDETALRELLTREPEDLKNDMAKILSSEKRRGWSEAVLKKFTEKSQKMVLKLIGRN